MFCDLSPQSHTKPNGIRTAALERNSNEGEDWEGIGKSQQMVIMMTMMLTKMLIVK